MTEEGLNNIRMMVVVTIIYEMTRTWPEDEKHILRDHFHKITFGKDGEHSSPFTREQRERFERLDPIRVANLTYFKTTDMGKRQLLVWYEMWTIVETEEIAARRQYAGTFAQVYRRFLEEIVITNTRKGERQNLGYQHISLNEKSLSDEERRLDIDRDAEMLVRIFEHVNFFNLFVPEFEQEHEGKDPVADTAFQRMTTRRDTAGSTALFGNQDIHPHLGHTSGFRGSMI